MEERHRTEVAPTGSLTLLTAPDCHLCGHGREVLERLGPELGIGWREVSSESPEGERLAAGAPPLRPVLLDADGRVLASGRLSEKRLRRDLARSVEPAGVSRG